MSEWSSDPPREAGWYLIINRDDMTNPSVQRFAPGLAFFKRAPQLRGKWPASTIFLRIPDPPPLKSAREELRDAVESHNPLSVDIASCHERLLLAARRVLEER